jgi:hypothetical protein
MRASVAPPRPADDGSQRRVVVIKVRIRGVVPGEYPPNAGVRLIRRNVFSVSDRMRMMGGFFSDVEGG